MQLLLIADYFLQKLIVHSQPPKLTQIQRSIPKGNISYYLFRTVLKKIEIKYNPVNSKRRNKCGSRQENNQAPDVGLPARTSFASNQAFNASQCGNHYVFLDKMSRITDN